MSLRLRRRFFDQPAYPGELLFFPTRRSSDLFSIGTRRVPFVPVTSSTAPATNRSEEHTSELQSHVNVVCRLLLEKKKRIRYERVEDFPERLQPATLYVAGEEPHMWRAAMLCP